MHPPPHDILFRDGMLHLAVPLLNKDFWLYVALNNEQFKRAGTSWQYHKI